VDALWAAVLPMLLLLGCLLLLRERFHLWAFLGFMVSYAAFVMIALWFYLVWLPPSASMLGLIAAYVLWSWRRMAVILNHVRGELVSWRLQTGAVTELLPLPPTSALTPHSLELDMTRAHHLSEFVTGSLQQLPVAVLLVDATGKVLMHNKMAQSVLADQTLIGSLASELLDMPSVAMANLDGCEFNTKTGVYQLHVVALTFKSADGHVVWQISLIDLSNERAAQRQRGELMAFLSHDLRVPQVGILSLLEMYRSPHSTLSADSFLNGVGEKAQKTLDAANDLVHLAQAQDGQYNMQEVNLVTLAQSAASQVRAQAGAKKITITLSRSMDDLFDLTWVMGDAGMLTRALMNIFTNAIRYSHSNTSVNVSLNMHDTHARYTIADEGLGMSESQTAQLNQMMTSGVATTHAPQHQSDVAGSLGVGLHMVATVVRHHGGSVVFASDGLGAGTTVHITLPVLPADTLAL
jgi:signal transduction histidine kinase